MAATTRRSAIGPIHPQDKYLFACDTEPEAERQCAIHAQTLVEQGLADEWGVYVRPTMIQVIKNKGRSKGKYERVYGLYVGRHGRED